MDTMAWLRVQLTDKEQEVVNEDRISHPNDRIRERMLVVWLLHNGVTRQKAAEITGVGRATVQRFVAAFRDGGLDGLRRWDPNRPESEMAAFRELIRESFEKQPARTVAEAGERIFELTGLRRGPSQVRKFVKDLGLKYQRVRMVPVPPKKNLAEYVETQSQFLRDELKPRLNAAVAEQGHVFFGRRGPHHVRDVLVLLVVVLADLRPRRLGSSAIQRPGGVECGDSPTHRRDQHHGRQHRDDV